LFAVLAAFAFIALATLRWDAWVGSATVQTTNDAYVRAELTRLSSRVAGEVITVAVKDFQRVKAGGADRPRRLRGAGRTGRGRRRRRAGSPR
jgi:membrane fusion protein, multidrug efflux system